MYGFVWSGVECSGKLGLTVVWLTGLPGANFRGLVLLLKNVEQTQQNPIQEYHYRIQMDNEYRRWTETRPRELVPPSLGSNDFTLSSLC